VFHEVLKIHSRKNNALLFHKSKTGLLFKIVLVKQPQCLNSLKQAHPSQNSDNSKTVELNAENITKTGNPCLLPSSVPEKLGINKKKHKSKMIFP
jgi:hypothetical protein